MPLSFNRAVQKLLGKRKYDLVYGLTQIYPQDVFRLGGGLEHSWFSIRYPKFWQQLINVIRPKVAVRLWVENKIFSPGNYKKIITNSRLCKNQLLSRYPIDPAAVTVAYNGIDRTNFSHHVRGQYRQQVREELKIPLTAKVILFVSHNWKRKGLRELIVALGRLKKDSLWLLVVGRGRPKRWRRLIAGQGLAKRVIFIGTTTTPWRYYGAADLFVLPTYYDPCANVCLEALACGLPVVTTKMNGASELICAGKNGYIVTRPQAVVELAEYINELLFCRDSELLAREALRAVKDLTLEKNVDMTIVALAEAGENQSAVNGVLAGNGYRSWLADKGWLAADKVMAFSGGQLLKKNKLRSVVRFEDKGKVYYLKRHFSRRGGVWARREWQNIFRLRSLGINTMTPVAVGWEPDGRQAYFITEALEDAERLEDFIPRYFKPPLSAEKSGQKRVLIRQLARLTKWLHDNCLFHKDFYSGHIFVRASGEGERFTLFLIDLQRVAEHRLLRGHWQVKDLTSLNFSCPFAAISDSDRIRFLRCYLGGNNFTGRRRQLLGRINRKTKKIAGHTEKMLARRKQCQM